MSIQTELRKSQSSKTYEKPDSPAANQPSSTGKNSRVSTSDHKLIGDKLQRIQNGGEIRYMDMFAGCGGISLGFLTAGFTPVASIEMDPWAAKSHGANFGSRSVGGDKEAHHTPRDAVTETADTVFGDLGLQGATDRQIDVLVGGPPPVRRSPV